MIPDRFWIHVDKDGPVAVEALGPCWVWTASVNNWGYPRFGDGYAHRLVAQESIGRPLERLERPDHLCRVRHCVNPAHIEVVTHAENIRRGKALLRPTHCPRGHEYAVHGRRNRRGSFECRTCDNARTRQRVRSK